MAVLDLQETLFTKNVNFNVGCGTTGQYIELIQLISMYVFARYSKCLNIFFMSVYVCLFSCCLFGLVSFVSCVHLPIYTYTYTPSPSSHHSQQHRCEIISSPLTSSCNLVQNRSNSYLCENAIHRLQLSVQHHCALKAHQ
jgi:hypothetical protein